MNNQFNRSVQSINLSLENAPSEKKSGIYKITNTLNGKVYVGQSRDTYKRLVRHRSDLRLNRHANIYLQNTWDKNGETSFTFEIVEYCGHKELSIREADWMDCYRSCEREYGYNLMLPNRELTSFFHSKESRVKMSASMRLYTNEELISYLQDFFYMEGRIYMSKDAENEKYKNYPKKHCYDVAFGSFENALIEADLVFFDKRNRLRRRNFHTKESILLQYTNFIDEFSRFPNSKEMYQTAIYDLPTMYVIKKLIGGIPQLREFLGYTLEKQKEEVLQESLDDLLREYNERGYIDHKLLGNQDSVSRKSSYYRTHFGTLKQAMTLAGIDIEKNKDRLKGIKISSVREVI